MNTLIKNLGILSFSIFFMASCVSGPQSKSLAYLFEDKSRLHSMTLRNFPNQPQARLTVEDKKNKRSWASHKTMKEGEFEAMWSLFKTDDLSRFYLANPGAQVVNLRENHVFFAGEVSKPEEAKMYIVPNSQAPQSVKTLAQAMRNYGRSPKSKPAR